MNLAQIHERLRLELVRRIQRGTVSVSLLARQTGFGQSHLSNFLHNRRQLSLHAIDTILAAQHLTFLDLLPAHSFPSHAATAEDRTGIPVVSHETALFERNIRAASVHSLFHIPAQSLLHLRSHASTARRAWQRFVAIRVAPADARAMDPLLLPDSLCVLDRHYASPRPYHASRPSLFAVRNGAHLTLRYTEPLAGRLILRPHNIAFPLEMFQMHEGDTPEQFLAGRVAFIFHHA